MHIYWHAKQMMEVVIKLIFLSFTSHVVYSIHEMDIQGEDVVFADENREELKCISILLRLANSPVNEIVT